MKNAELKTENEKDKIVSAIFHFQFSVLHL